VSGKLGGKGRARTLAYKATRGNGLTTTFVERSASGQRTIGVARAKRGTLRFAPADAPARRREVVAIVERNGFPRLEKVLAKYTAPKPARPGRVTKLRVRRRSRTLVVTWKGAKGAATYLVRADLGDGRRLERIVKGKARKLSIAGVGKRVSAKVKVGGRTAQGVEGKTARAKA
jgi:hypothetical protein